jgi:hypothetical protein
VSKKKIAPADNPPERLRKSIVDLTLANAGPHEPTVVFYAHLAAVEEISYGRHGLFCVLRARANGKDQVAEREFGTRFEDLLGCFHLSSFI